MKKHKLGKLYLIILCLMVLNLLSIITADEELYSNTTAMSDESSLWKHLKVETSKPLDRNMSFLNDSYILNQTTIHYTFIRIERTSLVLSSCW